MDKLQIELDIDQSKYDASNALVTLGKKQPQTLAKKTSKSKAKPVLLSNKRRKKLQKVLERKSKKINRAELINNLSGLQAKGEELDWMPSTSVVQTAGRKRVNELVEYYKAINNKEKNTVKSDDKFRARKFKLQKITLKSNEKNFYRKNPNVVGFEPDESESEDEEEEDSESGDSEDGEIGEVDDHPTEPPKEEILEPQISKQEVAEAVNDSPEPTKEANYVKTTYVPVNRTESVQKARLELPILHEECAVMEAIMYKPVVIICGETGSGKTTQVPQFLYESGFTMNNRMIGITEPRRVAAIAMSQRVAHELNLSSDEVSYQIRYEGNVTDKTKIKFMTDGVLMKEIRHDFLLRKYSAIIIDEAHERSLYSDILIGFLSRLVKTREERGDPLKLIIMSATLRVEDFTNNNRLFKNVPPVIKIDSRQFPVSVHFTKQTKPNYVKQAFNKVAKMHATLPDVGGILVFVTGRQEVETLCRQLRERFPFKADKFEDQDDDDQVEPHSREEESNEESCPTRKDNNSNPAALNCISLDHYSVTPNENVQRATDDFDYLDNHDPDDLDKEDSDLEDDDDDDGNDENRVDTDQPLYCLPLYSTLSNVKQARVFRSPPPGCRLCVIATNIAETSLTIPNIKYVVDTGKVKNKLYDSMTGISTFVIQWISKASADQRAGRAGRTSPGRCFRLYSSAVYNNHFARFSSPEIVVKPIDDLVLQMKSIGIDNVANFPFPTPPKIENIVAAEKRLVLLEALQDKIVFNKQHRKMNVSKITSLGRVMAHFPVNPRYAKMLCLSMQANLLPYVIAIVSGLTVQELFLTDGQSSNVFHQNGQCIVLGDILPILSAIGAVSFEGLSEQFCKHYRLRYKAMVEINKLRAQLTKQIKEVFPDVECSMEMAPPSPSDIKLLRQIMLCGFPDHVAKRIPVSTAIETDDHGNVVKKEKTVRNCYQSMEVEAPVYVSPHSVMLNEKPEYVVYHDIFESHDRMYMRCVVPIQPEWLPLYAARLCRFSKPLTDPPPRFDEAAGKMKCHVDASFGSFHWQLPTTEIDMPGANRSVDTK